MKDLSDLVSLVDKYDASYYNDFISLVSDTDYDAIKIQLSTLADEFYKKSNKTKKELELELRVKDALARIGAPLPEDGCWPKYQHEVPMASLNKATTPEELQSWYNKCNKPKSILLTEKMDGFSVSLKYVNGKLMVGSTRGNGDIGENITRNVRRMCGVPFVIDGFSGHIRGEIILLRSLFNKHFPDMANTRNATGMVRRINGEGCEHLTIFGYNVDGKDFETEVEVYDWLKSIGFNVPNYIVGSAKDFEKMWQQYMDKTRGTLDYDIDGLVGHINNRAERFALGDEGRGPKGSVAFKFKAAEANTCITDIACQVGDTGMITPVAIFDEVDLMGVKVCRSSLHNFSLVKELGLNIGAIVTVTRANDVIPYITEVVTPNNGYFKAPDVCPKCGTKTIRVGEYVKCPNKETCPAQVIGRLNKWIGELNILEWGESILSKLIESGKVSDVADLYKLTAQDITTLDRIGDKGAANVLAELDKFRSVTLENLIGGLCIDGIATSTVKLAMEAGYDTLDKLYTVTTNKLSEVKGFGDKKAQALCNGLKDNKHRIDNILAAGVTIKDKIHGNLNGTRICFTGTMHTPRKQLQTMVVNAGGEVDKTINKKTTHLVIDDVASTSEKAQAARKFGTKLIFEQEFLDMIK